MIEVRAWFAVRVGARRRARVRLGVWVEAEDALRLRVERMHTPCICHAYTMHMPCIHHAYGIFICIYLG